MANIILKPARRTYSLRLISGLVEELRSRSVDVNAMIEKCLCEALGLSLEDANQKALSKSKSYFDKVTRTKAQK